jgi:hypothetical protein
MSYRCQTFFRLFCLSQYVVAALEPLHDGDEAIPLLSHKRHTLS